LISEYKKQEVDDTVNCGPIDREEAIWHTHF